MRSSRCLRARRQRRDLDRRFLGAETLQGACAIIPHALQIRATGKSLHYSAPPRLGPLSPGCLWPLGPKSGSPPRAPPPLTQRPVPGSHPRPLPWFSSRVASLKLGNAREKTLNSSQTSFAVTHFKRMACQPLWRVTRQLQGLWPGQACRLGKLPEAQGSHSCRHGHGHGHWGRGPRSEPSLRLLKCLQGRRRACGGVRVSSAGSAFWKKTPEGEAQTEKEGAGRRQGREPGTGPHACPPGLRVQSPLHAEVQNRMAGIRVCYKTDGCL